MSPPDGDNVDAAIERAAQQSPRLEPELRAGTEDIGGLGPPRIAGLDPVQIVAGQIHVTATRGEQALLAAKLPVFSRGSVLVRPVLMPVMASNRRETVAAVLREMTPPALVDWLNHAVEWEKYDGRCERYVPTDATEKVANIILSRAGRWLLPAVAGIITTPTLRPDGSVLSEPGFDDATRLYHAVDPHLVMPKMVASPTRSKASKALAFLNGLLAEFPFVTDVDRAVALSGMITPVVRGAISAAPMHATRAPSAGTGKSFLVDLYSVIVTGRPCPVMTVGKNEEETEKRIGGMLLAGFPILNIDNVNGELGGDLLCQAIERPLVSMRPLGSSNIAEIENRTTIYATGNALRVRGDMTRRTLICNLDAKVERPEERTFTFNPVQRIAAARGMHVAACLTVVRAYLAAGSPSPCKPLASFEDWSNLVRSALVWLGEADPCESIKEAREDDPELSALRAVIEAWNRSIGLHTPMTAAELAGFATEVGTPAYGEMAEFKHPELREALLEIAGEKGSTFNTRRLGKWLLSNKGRIVGGSKVVKHSAEARNGVAQWQLVGVTDAA